METRGPARSQTIVAVLFALACVVLTIAAYVSFGGTTPFGPRGYEINIPVTNAGNLVAGSEVDLAGVTIGHVVTVRRDANDAIATVSIAPRYVPIHAGATAIPRTKTLLGEAYIEIAPGPHNAPPIPDGGQLPRTQVRTQVTLDQFLSAFAPTTRSRLRALFSGLSRAMAGRGPTLNDALGHAGPTTANLASVAQTLSGETPQLQQMFSSSGEVLAALGRREGDLQAAINAGQRVLTATAARDTQLAATVRSLPPFLNAVRTASLSITADSGDLDHAVSSLLPVAPFAAPALSKLNANGPQFISLFHELPATIHAGDIGLPSLSSILRPLPASATKTLGALQQLIPVAQVFAAYREPGLVAALAELGTITNGTMVAPGGKIVHRASATVYLSNETPLGWVKRLPSNRSNPYITPDGLSLLGKLGYLLSYDCRNIHNPDYLPPLGAGVPPCVQQGPWSFMGKTAFYPRPQPANP